MEGYAALVDSGLGSLLYTLLQVRGRTLFIVYD